MISFDFWNNKRVLITGGTGFVGSWLCMTLIVLGTDVYVMSRREGGEGGLFRACRLMSKVTLLKGDIRDKACVYSNIKKSCPDIIFHLAGQSVNSVANERPFYTYESNILGTLNIIESAKEIGVSKIVFVTSEHWDGKQTDNLSIYASSKACSEIIIKSLDRLYENKNPNMNILRMSNVIGGGDCELSRIVPYCIDCLVHNVPIILKKPQAKIKFLYVMDAITVLLQFAQGQFSSQTWSTSDIISDLKEMTVESIRDIVIEAYERDVDVDVHTVRTQSVFIKKMEDQELQIVSTSPVDAIRDSVCIRRLMSHQREEESITVYDACRTLITNTICFR